MKLLRISAVRTASSGRGHRERSWLRVRELLKVPLTFGNTDSGLRKEHRDSVLITQVTNVLYGNTETELPKTSIDLKWIWVGGEAVTRWQIGNKVLVMASNFTVWFWDNYILWWCTSQLIFSPTKWVNEYALEFPPFRVRWMYIAQCSWSSSCCME